MRTILSNLHPGAFSLVIETVLVALVLVGRGRSSESLLGFATQRVLYHYGGTFNRSKAVVRRLPVGAHLGLPRR